MKNLLSWEPPWPEGVLCLLGLGLGSRDGAVVRALAPTNVTPASTPGLGSICGLSLLLVLFSAPRGFSPGSPVFPSPKKTTLGEIPIRSRCSDV